MNELDGRFAVGLEEGVDGGFLAHALDVPGCAAPGDTAEAAVENFAATLQQWLQFLAFIGAPIPADDAELEVAVDEWIATDARVLAGETTVCFAADLRALSDDDIQAGLRSLGELRGLLLAHVRRRPDAELDRPARDGWRVRDILEELARAQWWTLSRLGATPMAETPERTLGRLDTAMALVVRIFTDLPADRRDTRLEIEGEEWTPRKVLRRLAWLEWTLGRTAQWALESEIR
ncbi:MAG TPA: type II toxin-antitoxin system HicB family antitoxin [Longimicrobium sp.]|nr:type II toxin-antitoxin system HicB family antitoxin [Longimicrobium sp.]